MLSVFEHRGCHLPTELRKILSALEYRGCHLPTELRKILSALEHRGCHLPTEFIKFLRCINSSVSAQCQPNIDHIGSTGRSSALNIHYICSSFVQIGKFQRILFFKLILIEFNFIRMMAKKVSDVCINDSKYKATVERLYNEVANTKIFTDQDIVDEKSEATDGAVNIENESLDEMWEEFDAEVEQYLRPGNQMTSAIVELDKYLAEPILPRKDKNGKNQCPLMWWNQRKHIYPRLYEIVKTRLCISGTSVPCERVFSHAGQIISEKRENIKVSKLSQMVFLNYNIDNKDF